MGPSSAVPATLDRRVLTALAFLTTLVAAYAQRQADPDLWGHLQYGRLFLENGPLVEDPFAYGSPGRHWYTHEYLAQMALALAYNLAGPPGLLVLKSLLGAGAIACLYGCLRTTSADPRLWAPLLMLTTLSLGRWFQFRPQLFTYLFLALFVLILFRYLLGRSNRLYLLPLLMPLWVNLHGGFLAGIGAVGLALAGRILQAIQRDGFHLTKLWSAVWPLLVTLLCCLAGTLAQPLGWKLFPYLATEFGQSANGRYLQEWGPVSLTDFWTMFFLGLLLGLLILLTLLARRRTRRIADLAPWQWLLSCVPLTVMALMSQRHIPILTIWATPVLGLLAQAAFADVPESCSSQRLWFGISGLITGAAVLVVSLVLTDPRPGIRIDGRALGNTHPHGVMSFLRANNLEGNLYAPLWWGSYFTWELYPKIRVALDGRNVTRFDPEDVTANLVFYHEKLEDPVFPHWRLTRFLAIPADAPILETVRRDSRWLLAYQDGQASLFVKNTEQNEIEEKKWRQQPMTESERAVPKYLR